MNYLFLNKPVDGSVEVHVDEKLESLIKMNDSVFHRD